MFYFVPWVQARDSLQPKRLVWQFPTVRYLAERSTPDGPKPMTMRDVLTILFKVSNLVAADYLCVVLCYCGCEQTVVGAIASQLGDNIDTYPVGYAPVGHLCFELPEEQVLASRPQHLS